MYVSNGFSSEKYKNVCKYLNVPVGTHTIMHLHVFYGTQIHTSQTQ